MTEREMFRVFTRIVGLILIGFGTADAVGSGLTLIGIQSSHPYSALDRAGAAVAYIVPGLIVLLAADALARLFYGRDTSSS